MLNQFLRTQRLFHREDMEKLNRHTFATRKTVGQKVWKR